MRKTRAFQNVQQAACPCKQRHREGETDRRGGKAQRRGQVGVQSKMNKRAGRHQTSSAK